MNISDLTDIAKNSESTIIQSVLKSGGSVRAIVCPRNLSRKQIDELTELCIKAGGKGLMSIKPGTPAKFFSTSEQEQIVKIAGATPESTLLIVADKRASEILGSLRLHLGEQLGLREKMRFVPCWVTDFPMFEQLESGEVGARHHPFTSPRDEDLSLMVEKPFEVKAKAYDLVINGVEIGGGSIRIHRSDVQERVFRTLGLSESEVQEKFGFLLEAFQYGAPPHGGIALGLDRMVAMMAGFESIREVIALPKTQTGQDLMTGAPTPVSEAQLKELHIRPIEDRK
jgi:aspartyl-tRNA synthetase